MSESDSQNVSARRYGGSVEVESFTVSSNDSVINTVETYSHDAPGPSRLADDVLVNKPDLVIPEDVSRPVTGLLTLEVNTSGQGKPPDWSAGLPADSTPPTTATRQFLSSEDPTPQSFLSPDSFLRDFTMFWRMAGLSTASPVETILDKDNFTLEELLDEDEIIQECKALNGRLINFLLASKLWNVNRLDLNSHVLSFCFPFIACEIFTCEVDIILKALVDDEELMNLLFLVFGTCASSQCSVGCYFSKSHQEVIRKLVDLIGITSIMEVLIRLISSDEHMYSNFVDSMQWLGDTDVLEMIVDKFSSAALQFPVYVGLGSNNLPGALMLVEIHGLQMGPCGEVFGALDCPEVHANAAEILCAITRYAPPGLSTKISSPSFIGRLFCHALEGSRPKSVLVNSLSICISLLDPKRLTSGTYYFFNRQSTQGTGVTANPKTVEGMLESLDKPLDVPGQTEVVVLEESLLVPLCQGSNINLQIVEFISVLVSVSSEAAEKELIRLGAVKRILDLFFEYPYNNFLHHNVEHIVVSCLESKNAQFVDHVLSECNLVGKILEAEKNLTVTTDSSKENSEWLNGIQMSYKNGMLWKMFSVGMWHFDMGSIAMMTWMRCLSYFYCRTVSLAKAHGALERDDEDVYFDDESAEVVISSLRLGDDQDSGSLFTNSNWFAFEDDRMANDRQPGPVASPSPKTNADAPVSANNDKSNAEGEGGSADLVHPAAAPNSGTHLQKQQKGTQRVLACYKQRSGAITKAGGGFIVLSGDDSFPLRWGVLSSVILLTVTSADDFSRLVLLFISSVTAGLADCCTRSKNIVYIS
nr:serine/threonine-protein phosphatase 6 regulatory subunit 3 isoform X1 [Ipomoea batatas]